MASPDLSSGFTKQEFKSGAIRFLRKVWTKIFLCSTTVGFPSSVLGICFLYVPKTLLERAEHPPFLLCFYLKQRRRGVIERDGDWPSG